MELPPFFSDGDDERVRAIRQQILLYQTTGLMNDRERARWLGLPSGCRIRENAKILAPEKLVLGCNVWIGEGVILDAQGGLEIGDETQIGSYAMIWTHSSHKQALRGETGQTRDSIRYAPTRIGSCSFIAGPSVVAAGVTIGDRVMVLPHTLVDRDVPSGSVVGISRDVRHLEQRITRLERRIQEL